MEGTATAADNRKMAGKSRHMGKKIEKWGKIERKVRKEDLIRSSGEEVDEVDGREPGLDDFGECTGEQSQEGRVWGRGGRGDRNS